MKDDTQDFYLLVLHLERRLREVDRDLALSGTRFSVLASLTFHGTRNLSDLAEDERVSRPAISRLAKDMEKEGLISTRPDPTDGRGVQVEITDKGTAALFSSRTRKLEIVEACLGELKARERASFGKVVKKLTTVVWPT